MYLEEASVHSCLETNLEGYETRALAPNSLLKMHVKSGESTYYVRKAERSW